MLAGFVARGCVIALTHAPGPENGIVVPKSLDTDEKNDTIAHFRTSFPVSPDGAINILTDNSCLDKGNMHKNFYHSNMILNTNFHLPSA